MTEANSTNVVEEFEREVLARIPLAVAMQIGVAEYSAARLVLAAPFAPNRNHTGIAFGGAIECLGTLACWGLLWLELASPETMIAIQHGETDFLAPVTGELRAEACRPDAAAWQHFTQSLSRHGRGRIALTAEIGSVERAACARFRGRFVAIRKD